ncbi:unnamed protein product, partial [marine sediment metagenome]
MHFATIAIKIFPHSNKAIFLTKNDDIYSNLFLLNGSQISIKDGALSIGSGRA